MSSTEDARAPKIARNDNGDGSGFVDSEEEKPSPLMALPNEVMELKLNQGIENFRYRGYFY